jgi:hypothetical protein
VPENFEADSTFIESLMTAPNSADMNFALAYNPVAGVEDGLDPATVLEDIRDMGRFLNMPNAAATDNNIKYLYITSGASITSDTSSTFFDDIREMLRTEHNIEVYMIGEQPEWTPPLRFEHRLKGVDAISHRSYIEIGPQGNQSYYDRLIQFEQYVDIALTVSAEETARAGFHYIPQISPSYDATITNPSSLNYVIDKDEAWFRTFASIAKRASTNNPNNVIIVDSFNNWNFNKQLEPAESYNTQFLDILRDEFKLPN